MFDHFSIPIPCKKCGKDRFDGQTKDAYCELKVFTLQDGYLYSKNGEGYDDEPVPLDRPDYYSGHMDAYVSCCGEWTTVRHIFVRGKLEYKEKREQ